MYLNSELYIKSITHVHHMFVRSIQHHTPDTLQWRCHSEGPDSFGDMVWNSSLRKTQKLDNLAHDLKKICASIWLISGLTYINVKKIWSSTMLAVKISKQFIYTCINTDFEIRLRLYCRSISFNYHEHHYSSNKLLEIEDGVKAKKEVIIIIRLNALSASKHEFEGWFITEQLLFKF